MKVIAALSTLIVLASSAPQQSSRDATILKYESNNIGVDGYNFAFETSDGMSRSETGELKNAGTDNEFIAVRGTISWIGLDGTPYSIEFIADENGFQPKGAHLPK
ncbi:endocuticle structural protein SgAbd-6-like [Cylas formicarius]|uniref:endocuticle structural protein SgAbd-6-like n=1 Tax=Cylas formicarius TaxID=197179 RepID=UPI002958422C|nr:endocuticle structural protein SgAbd-6-like [Cylas formicarius]